MDVFAVERRDERPIDSIDDVVREIVGFVLEVLDRGDLGLQLLRGHEHLVEQRRRGREPHRELREQIVELFVARQDPQNSISGVVLMTRPSPRSSSRGI